MPVEEQGCAFMKASRCLGSRFIFPLLPEEPWLPVVREPDVFRLVE